MHEGGLISRLKERIHWTEIPISFVGLITLNYAGCPLFKFTIRTPRVFPGHSTKLRSAVILVSKRDPKSLFTKPSNSSPLKITKLCSTAVATMWFTTISWCRAWRYFVRRHLPFLWAKQFSILTLICESSRLKFSCCGVRCPLFLNGVMTYGKN